MIMLFFYLFCKGFGVFTRKSFSKGDFLLEYSGEGVSASVGRSRVENYPKHLGSFLFFFEKYWYI